jgi:mono/diheme cytochrome c family protein
MEAARTEPGPVLSFEALFGRNCAGCHGPNGRGGAAIPLGDPAYLAIADDENIRLAIEEGVSGTPMAAWSRSEGGMLTEEQIDVLVRGLRGWARGGTPPPDAAETAGDAPRGAEVYRTRCDSCHGAKGTAGSIVDPSYLALVSDRYLRLNVVLHRPGWEPPLTAQEVADVVAWLTERRKGE